MIPVKVLKISYHPSSRSYTVILKEITGDMCLPVIVGTFEAQSIALAMEMVHTPRPLTHDLICDVITNINGNLNAIKINQLDDGWTILTADGKVSAHFEHNVALINGKPELLSTFDYIYKSLGLSSSEERPFRKEYLAL